MLYHNWKSQMIVRALYARKKWQSWNVNYYFLTTKFFDNSQSTHPHFPSKLGTSSWNNLNLCSKQLWCQIVFRHVGQIKSWGPNSFVHFGPRLFFSKYFKHHFSMIDVCLPVEVKDFLEQEVGNHWLIFVIIWKVLSLRTVLRLSDYYSNRTLNLVLY